MVGERRRMRALLRACLLDTNVQRRSVMIDDPCDAYAQPGPGYGYVPGCARGLWALSQPAHQDRRGYARYSVRLITYARRSHPRLDCATVPGVARGRLTVVRVVQDDARPADVRPRAERVEFPTKEERDQLPCGATTTGCIGIGRRHNGVCCIGSCRRNTGCIGIDR
jgi:hypothetical protein